MDDMILPPMEAPVDAVRRVHLIEDMLLQRKIDTRTARALFVGVQTWMQTYYLNQMLEDQSPDWK